MLYKYIQIDLHSRCWYIYYIHSCEAATVKCEVNVKETVTVQVKQSEGGGKVASVGTQILPVDTGHGHEAWYTDTRREGSTQRPVTNAVRGSTVTRTNTKPTTEKTSS